MRKGRRMAHSERVRRGAVIGLAVTLLTLIALSVVGAASTRRCAEVVSRATGLAEAYDRAHDAVIVEESLERKYRLEPDAAVRAAHVEAGQQLQAALVDIAHQGTATDRDIVRAVRALHADYLAALQRMFTAVDAGANATAMQIDTDEIDPRFGWISDHIQRATDTHTGTAAAAVAQLHRVEGLVFATTVAGLGVGLALLAAFGFIAVGYQRTLLRQAADSRHQALHDPLTDLPNRVLFTDRLTQALLGAQRGGGSTAVLLLDLDRFKEVNDTLGHHYGDELLRQVAARASGTLRASDTVARLSGDEFAILLTDTDAPRAVTLAERMLADLHRSFTLDDVTVDVEASIGVAVGPGHGTSADTLLRGADIAMYAAKDIKTGVVLYRPEMHTEDAGRLLLLGDLRRALDTTDQLTLHYQPKISLGLGELCGVEALIRWRHPTQGMVSPADFIPVAETTGLINRLTVYVLRMAIGQARSWLDQGFAVPVAVNLSPRCLLDPSLVAHVTDTLREFELPARLLRLEVTETAVMANPALALTTLTELHELGIRLSIDDYGTGYSSMAYLKRLPVDELKVDRTFVLNMDADHDDAVLVRSAIDLGHNLGLTVVAEGVEGEAHVAALQDLGCDIAQGYHYARPMPSQDLTTWMRAHQLTEPSPSVPTTP
jgi:diguanylate cyclase (GGDEF)-like protein